MLRGTGERSVIRAGKISWALRDRLRGFVHALIACVNVLDVELRGLDAMCIYMNTVRVWWILFGDYRPLFGDLLYADGTLLDNVTGLHRTTSTLYGILRCRHFHSLGCLELGSVNTCDHAACAILPIRCLRASVHRYRTAPFKRVCARNKPHAWVINAPVSAVNACRRLL